MYINEIIHVVVPSQRRSGIAGLVRDILILEERLRVPERQSEYFRWSVNYHQNHLAGLKERYAKKRAEFNTHNIYQFEDEIAAQKLQMQKYANLSPLFNRYLVRSYAEGIIREMEDMIHLKRIVDQIPTIAELKNEPELLEALWEIPHR